MQCYKSGRARVCVHDADDLCYLNSDEFTVDNTIKYPINDGVHDRFEHTNNYPNFKRDLDGVHDKFEHTNNYPNFKRDLDAYKLYDHYANNNTDNNHHSYYDNSDNQCDEHSNEHSNHH